MKNILSGHAVMSSPPPWKLRAQSAEGLLARALTAAANRLRNALARWPAGPPPALPSRPHLIGSRARFRESFPPFDHGNRGPLSGNFQLPPIPAAPGPRSFSWLPPRAAQRRDLGKTAMPLNVSALFVSLVLLCVRLCVLSVSAMKRRFHPSDAPPQFLLAGYNPGNAISDPSYAPDARDRSAPLLGP
jgi:hypothetical protein